MSMENKLVKIFKQAKYEPAQNLAFSVWHKVTLRERRITQFKLWALVSASLASLAGLVPAFQILANDLAHSGFYEYFSLIFSDGGSMFSSWRELSLSIAESLPTMSIIFILSLLFVCFLSLKYLAKLIGRGELNSASLLLSI